MKRKFQFTFFTAVIAVAGVLGLAAQPAQAQFNQAQVLGKAMQFWQYASANPQFMQAPVGAAGPCRDPWVSSAFRIVFQREANATGDNGECNYRNFGGGSWSSYQDLMWKVAWYRAYKELGLVRGGAAVDASLASPQGITPSLAAAISEVTGQAPDGEVNPAQFGLGYDEVKSRVEAVYLPCANDQISKAVLAITGRPAKGTENQGECNAGWYGGGKWASYQDLQAKVKTALVTTPFKTGECRIGELTNAITQYKKAKGMTATLPAGSGELGECNSYLYGYAQWSSYGDLKAKVAKTLDELRASNLQLQPDNSIKAVRMERGGEGAIMALLAAANAYMQWKVSQPAKQPKQQNNQMMMPQPMPQQPNMIQPGVQMPAQPMMQPQMMQDPQMMQPPMMPQQPMMPGM